MLRMLVFALLALVPSLVFSQDDIQKIAQQIRSSDRLPTAEQQAAFLYVFNNYARAPETTPEPLQDALYVYLDKVANSPVTSLPTGGCSRNSTELPLKIALDYSHHVSDETLSALAARPDICYDGRAKAVNDLPSTSSELLSLGKGMMKKESSDDKAIAVVALTRMSQYPPEAADFLIGQMALKKGLVPSKLMESTEVEKAFKYASPQGKSTLKQLIKSGEVSADSNLK